jgi:hypothetical protein
MFSDKRFGEVKKRFNQVQANYFNLIEEKRKSSKKTIISKGRLYNVLPFENERTGFKVKGKIISEIIIHNECYIYRFDSQNNVTLSEQMSKFLKIPTYFTLYSYRDDFIERIYGDNDELYRVEWVYLEQKKVKEMLCWSVKSCIFEVYNYDQSMLQSINCFQKPHKETECNYDIIFHYSNETLSSIHRKWPTGEEETDFP